MPRPTGCRTVAAAHQSHGAPDHDGAAIKASADRPRAGRQPESPITGIAITAAAKTRIPRSITLPSMRGATALPPATQCDRASLSGIACQRADQLSAGSPRAPASSPLRSSSSCQRATIGRQLTAAGTKRVAGRIQRPAHAVRIRPGAQPIDARRHVSHADQPSRMRNRCSRAVSASNSSSRASRCRGSGWMSTRFRSRRWPRRPERWRTLKIIGRVANACSTGRPRNRRCATSR